MKKVGWIIAVPFVDIYAKTAVSECSAVLRHSLLAGCMRQYKLRCHNQLAIKNKAKAAKYVRHISLVFVLLLKSIFSFTLTVTASKQAEVLPNSGTRSFCRHA